MSRQKAGRSSRRGRSALQRKAHRADQAIGVALRSLRVDRDLSQERLADMAGLHRNFIGYIERGERNLSIETLVKIADALQYPVWQIVRDAGIELGPAPKARDAGSRRGSRGRR
jgi:transcriptional regulator with XRE-family HTH domain